ncbi:MAG: diaminopimelate epimerase [Bdellovibrionales bacterium]|nr:diaminopimelate epimerase [Bdellovibrionales bacterium]
MKLIKMHGTGNDFLFAVTLNDANSWPPDKSKRAKLVIQLCDRNFGVGADGLAFIENHPDLDFAWDFYNSDGSHAEMCGNAARCAALLFSRLNNQQTEIHFETAFGIIEAHVQDTNTISLQTGEVQVLAEPQEFVSDLENLKWSFTHLDTGVPHAVVEFAADEELQTTSSKVAASELRRSPLVGPRGSNVTFYKSLSQNHIQAVSFERGVEDFTLACGTGVIAAAFVKAQKEKIESVQVSIPGGELSVDFRGKLPTLRGPAKFVANIDLDPDFLD